MQTEIIAQLVLILPEILIALGIMALLLIGVYSGAHSYLTVTGLTIALLFATIILIVLFPKDGFFYTNALIIDAFSRYMKILTLIGALFSLILSVGFSSSQKFDIFEFPILVLLATLGMMLMISSGNMLSLYMGLELQSLALYVLAAIHRDNVKSSEAGIKYFVLGALSSGLLLYGISLLYGFTGQIGFREISSALNGNILHLGVIFGIVFVLAGLAFKISAVPFHMWTPDVYEGAPTPITAFFAGAPKIAAMALIIRVIVFAFIPLESSDNFMPAWQQILVFMAISSMALGAFAAIGQTNIKRLMAYSSIGHMGYALVGLAAGNILGVKGILIYMTIYLGMTIGSFAFILGMRFSNRYVENIYDLAGLVKTNPFMAIVMTIQLFSLASIPPMAGFFGKWYTFSAAVHAGLVPLAIVGMVLSVIGAFYYLRIIKIMWFDDAKDSFVILSNEIKLCLCLSALFVLFYVFFGFWFSEFAEKAATSLFQ
ncbi:NADH-quinone oxidoreductase subunit N [Bartonella bacilliformis str. Heidi Mejia]|uniref:NADH-quinone oxidoreductase subunit NuoN n=1 Tax=Bartonella bacilliformis TaxID=774 RepID=UPI0004520FA2|nr:NADH-quinone oxidoreductase subunit NuoN [Bartonella bacilliformis]EYS91979.1 NADH-quinone oxidoreductase subunit N [Bartonella bacilliformis str. Heidi Mejia]KEG18949.1 NADH-quinone oxidoreductase subunit N [Bartonella bacilliformis Hosp800-02]KEG23460.1 NADH-quinone oxidoreductase subunit N [Bartonella bacilliformis VAB9028]KEG24406.1 NADH-quinone oxidoreductase subunit N [Bartonella bacilliformis CAR600-02]